MTSQDAFIGRLRRYRERRRITLDEIAVTTRISRERLDAFERNDLDNWPRGVYARAWVRAYAAIVGLDPTDTVEEFCRLFPHGDRRVGGTLQDMAAIVAHASDYRDDIPAGVDRRRPEPNMCVAARPAWQAALARPLHALWIRLTLKPSPVRLQRRSSS